MGAAEVSAYVSALAVGDRMSASTQNQALSALLCLYKDVLQAPLPAIDVKARARTPVRLPVVLTRDEVRAVLRQLTGTARLITEILYGSGLRLSECLALRVKDIDFARRTIVVRRGKSQKDRVTLLSGSVVEPLQEHLKSVRELLRPMNWFQNLESRPEGLRYKRRTSWKTATTSARFRSCSATRT
jgi:integrase